MSKIPAINEIDANSPSQESKEVVIKATDVSPDINEIQETISSAATIQEVDGTRKPTISEIYKIVTDGLFESTSNWWDYAYKLSQAQINQDIISRLDRGEIGGGYSKGVDIITTTKNSIPTNTNVYSALKSDTLYPKKLNNETINGIYNFINGITIGKPTAYTGGTWSVDQLGKTHLTTDYLYVRLKAIFETLQILNVDTIGGKLVISPAGSITIVYVDNIKVTIDDNEQNVYRCYFLGEQEGEEIENKWKVGDQAQAKSFNVKKGTYHKTGNHYLWRLVVGVSTDTVTIDGKKYHYVDLSQLIFDTGSDAPAPGDVLNQLGHRGDDLQRQTAIVLNAVDNYAPSITLYAGITDFTLLNKEYVEYGVYQGKAFFNVYGDMYIGDKGTNPTTYIKFKNGKLDIKANLTIGSSIDGKDLDKYIKENGGVDEKTVISLINNSQVIKDLQNQADGAIETWFYEGEPTLKNLPAVDWTTNELKKIHVGDLYYDQITGFAYRFTRYNDGVTPYAWNRIKDNDIVKALEAASHAQATADSKMKIFYGEAKPTNYQAGDMWVNATLAGKFDNDIARSTTTSETFDADHWVLASRYSEAIQSLLNWSNQYTTKFEDLTKVVKEQKDQSISNWFYDYKPTDSNAPANLWNTEELRKEHIGDIFYDTKNNHSYRWTGSAWSMIKDADFDKAMEKAKDAEDLADKKRQIFYSDTTPTGGDRGDLWMKQVGTKTEVWVFDGTNWVKSNDKALADYSEAINKELQGIKGQLDGKAETWYQANDPSTSWTNKTSHEGDIWYNTTDGTTQYWNGKAWEKMDIPKDVFDTIDGKSSIFVDSYDDAKAGKGVISNGYNERDIWILPADAIVNGVQYYKGDILTATADGTVFNEKHWTKKVRYVGDKELNNAIDKVNKKINDISATTLPGLDNKFNEFAKDGIIDSSEKARLTDLLNQANNDVLAANDQIISIIKSDYLTNDNVNKGKLIEAQKTLSTAWTEYKTLINTLITSKNPITKNNIAEASSKYTNLQNSIKAVKQYLAACQADVLSNLGIDINSYKYLKEAFRGKTEVNGGLVVTNVLQLRQTSDVNSPITAGISGLQGKANENGVVDKDTYDITAIAAWFGGPMVDKNIFTDEQLKTKVAGTDYARSLFRHDGSGYLASGAIYWGTDGILHGNPNSFILQGTSLATMFNYIRLFYIHYARTDEEGITGVDYITPTKTFSRLDILTQGGTEAGLNLPTGLFIGSSATGGSFQVGNVIIRTKEGDPNILEIVSATDGKKAHLGVQGGVSAYGTYTPSTGGGGELNASVIAYANAIVLTTEQLNQVASAYSISALSKRIDNIATELGGLNLSWENITGKPTTFTPSAHTHKWIDITDRITKVSQLTNDVGYLTSHQSLADYAKKSEIPTKVSQLKNDSGYLTAHQSLVNYYTKTEIDAKGYTTNKGTVTSVGLTLPTGLTCATKSITTSGTFAITFTSGYSIPTTTKQTAWDSAVSVKHSHTNKSVLDGISSAKITHWDSAYNWYSLMTTDEETADGIINKWNEVVNFLANIEQTDTLSGIIDGINTSISNEVSRAKKAEGTNASNISANKTSITTLQGYFTNGSAKKALQLTTARKFWGNNFNGTTDINGSIVLPSGKYISIGNIKLEYDETNKALKITNTVTNEVANVYTTGGITAYGVGSVSGGGLNASVLNYESAIKLTSTGDNELSQLASAWSIAKLNSRIVSLEDGSALDVVTSGTGNAVTAISKNGTTINVTKGTSFLTAHQSLANYLTKTDASNTYLTKTDASSIYQPKGNYLTAHQSFTDLCATLSAGYSVFVDDTEFVTSIADANGFSNTSALNVPYKRKASKLWEYIKNKADSLYQSVGTYAFSDVNNGAAKWLLGSYTNNGGQQNPNYFGTNKIGALMMNTEVEGSIGYKDWIILDCYSGNDAGGAVAIGVNRQTLGAYIMRSDSSRKTWSNKATLIGTHNYKNYVYSTSDIDTKLSTYATQSWVNNKGYITSSSSISGNAATATNADKVDGYHAYQLFRDLGWWNSSETHNANSIKGNASVFAYSTHSNVPVTGVLTTFSGGNDAYNWQISKSYSDRRLYFRYRNGTAKTWSDWLQLVDESDLKWSSISNRPTALSQFTNDSGYITSTASITGNAGSATKLQTSRKLWNNNFNGTGDIGGTILPSATHTYNLGSTTYMFERTYTRYIETDSGYDLRLICAGNELMRLSSSDNVVYFNSQGLNIKNNVSSGCSMSISEIRDSELNYGQINVVDTNGSRPKGRHLVLQYEQGNVGIGVKYPSEKLEVNGNILVNTSSTSGDKGLKIKANSRNLLFGVGTSTKIGVYNYSGNNWLFYTDTSTFYTSGGILATGGITAYSSSDIRLKQNLYKLDYLNIIKAMGGSYGFTWRKDNKHSIGWIAQHVLNNPYMRDIVETDENGYYKINYWSPKLIATAFGAIEQVDDEVSKLKARVTYLESEVERLTNDNKLLMNK